jgi:hypothetical protein
MLDDLPMMVRFTQLQRKLNNHQLINHYSYVRLGGDCLVFTSHEPLVA